MTIKINGVVIPEQAIQYELDRLIKFYSQHISADEIMKQMPALKLKAKDQAIGAKLLINEAARLDIQVPAEDVDQRFDVMVKSGGGKKKFASLLQQKGMSEEAVRKSIEQGRKVDLLVERITQVVPEPTEAELLEHFTKHRSEYRKPERVHVRHILLRFDSDSPADKETARSRMLEIRQKIKEGADFVDQAEVHSDCPSGKKSGGDLGWISRGMTIPEFDSAVFAMKVGALGEVLESPLGFHVIHKLAHEKASEGDFDEERERIRDFLRHSYRGEAISAYVNELKQKAEIEESAKE